MIGVSLCDDLGDDGQAIEIVFRFNKDASGERDAVTLLGYARQIAPSGSRIAAEIGANMAYLEVLARFDDASDEDM